jgi:hypothetical protein
MKNKLSNISFSLKRLKMKCVLLLIVTLASCTTKSVKTGMLEPSDSIIVVGDDILLSDSSFIWINAGFLNSMNENISICDCWRDNKYQLLYYDTIEMELYLKSNLMYFGHDSEFILPISKTDNRYIYDSTIYESFVERKEFEVYSDDSLILIEGNSSYKFVKKYFPVKAGQKQEFYSDFSDLFYQYSSYTLLKYQTIDTVRSSYELISPEILRNNILNGLTSGHCSDDGYFDGLTIEGDTNRYFELRFSKEELVLYENYGRNRYEKLDLNSLPKQVMIIDENNIK